VRSRAERYRELVLKLWMIDVAGFLSAIAGAVILALVGVEDPVGWVLSIAFLGWTIFVVRDAIRRRAD
jgi:hypothetical protein